MDGNKCAEHANDVVRVVNGSLALRARNGYNVMLLQPSLRVVTPERPAMVNQPERSRWVEEMAHR